MEKVVNFVWQKRSHKRWSARVGSLSIEVIRVGIKDDKYWTVGEVFGVFHHGLLRDERLSLEEAQREAERVAARLFSEASDAIKSARIA